MSAPTRNPLRWMPFTGQPWTLKSLTPDRRNWVRFQCKRHRESFLTGSCGVLHGSTSKGSGPG